MRGETVTHILVTHTHRDHSPNTGRLKAATGNPQLLAVTQAHRCPLAPDELPGAVGNQLDHDLCVQVAGDPLLDCEQRLHLVKC